MSDAEKREKLIVIKKLEGLEKELKVCCEFKTRQYGKMAWYCRLEINSWRYIGCWSMGDDFFIDYFRTDRLMDCPQSALKFYFLFTYFSSWHIQKVWLTRYSICIIKRCTVDNLRSYLDLGSIEIGEQSVAGGESCATPSYG